MLQYKSGTINENQQTADRMMLTFYQVLKISSASSPHAAVGGPSSRSHQHGHGAPDVPLDQSTPATLHLTTTRDQFFMRAIRVRLCLPGRCVRPLVWRSRDSMHIRSMAALAHSWQGSQGVRCSLHPSSKAAVVRWPSSSKSELSEVYR